jgi:hypothetical protein
MMSHFTSIKTELRNLNSVQTALKRLGLEFQVGGVLEDYSHNVRKVDLLVKIPGQHAAGFVRDERTGVIELVGDWFAGRTSRQTFLDSLKCNYAREEVLRSLEQQGVDISKVKEIEEPDGSVVFELRLDEEELQALNAG